MKAINKALFLDLDGTIIVTKSGDKFPRDKNDWQYNRNILEKIEIYVDAGYHVMVVSNQGGIEKGIVKLNDFREKIRKVINGIITRTGIPFEHIGYRYAIGNHVDDFYRKPNPGMAYDLALSYILDLSRSLMIGDASGNLREKIPIFVDVRLTEATDGWSYKDGSPVPEVVLNSPTNKVERTSSVTANLLIYDFADSDKKFAERAGMFYTDINVFLDPEITLNHIKDEASTINRNGASKVHVQGANVPSNQ